MKKLLLSFAVVTSSFVATSQVIFQVKTPSVIAGNYAFSDNGQGSSWGLANLLDPTVAVEDTLVIVNDGTPGTNAQGNPISAEGCSALTNGAQVSGNIAVVYRNTCAFGLKALNAQTAGARAVIIVNRDPEVIAMNGGTEGLSVTIPVIFISSIDGQFIIDEMLNGPVVAFIGSKAGYFGNDLGTMAKDAMIAKQYSNPTLLTQNASDFAVDLGLQVRNFGTNDQTGITVTATVKKGASQLYTETSAPFDLLAGDSTIISTFTPFSQSTYALGKYTLSYEINSTATDADTTDNLFTADFVVNDSLFSLAPLDDVTNLPVNNSGSQPSTFTANYDECIVFTNANAARMKVEGLYFSASTNSTDSLAGQNITITAHEVIDVFTDLNDAPATGSLQTNPLTYGYYTYDPAGLQDNLQRAMLYSTFDEPISLENNKRYLFCVQAASDKVFLGYSTKLSYEMNVSMLAQPLVPVITDGSINLFGFGGENVPAIALKMSLNDVGLSEINKVEAKIYPNPTKNNVTITLPESGEAKVQITDITGKVVANNTINVVNGKSVINMDNMQAGMYILNVTINDKVAKINVVKQ
jgi:hypothetical protein